MNGPVGEGAAAVLHVTREDQLVTVSGTVAVAKGRGFAIVTPEAANIRPGDHVGLAADDGRWQLVASARCRAVAGERVVLELAGDWRDFRTRGAPRYPLTLPARVRPEGTSIFTGGLLRDVSSGGMAFGAEDGVQERRLEVAVELDGYATWIPCRRVSSSEAAEGGFTHHLRYGRLGAGEGTMVRRILAYAVGGAPAAEDGSRPAIAARTGAWARARATRSA